MPTDHDRIRVGLDAHVVGHQRTGNETYVLGLAHALMARPDIELTAYVDRGVDWPSDGTTAGPRLRRLIAGRPEPRIALELPIRARRDQVDLLHVQYVAPPIAGLPVVTTVHDLSFLDVPETMSWARRWRLRLTVGVAARRSSVVLTVSEFSRQRLLHHFDVPPERVVVAPPIVIPPPVPDDPEGVIGRLGVRSPFVLAVGDVHPRKNLPALVAAIADVRRRGLEIGLVIAGQRAWRAEALAEAIAAHDAGSWVQSLGYVDPPTLGALYRVARVVAYVSLYEGFGLPAVEAMALGTPVVASDRTSMPEVAGDGARYVDPTEVASIADGLLEAATDAALRTRLVDAGHRRAALYRPEAAVGATVAAYRRALSA